MNKTFKIIIFFLIAVFLMAASLIGVVSYANRYINETQYQFFCKDIQKGMLKEEVKRVIDKYGSYSWKDDNVIGLSYAYFDQFVPMNTLGSPIVLRFDSDNRLIAIGSRYKVGDELQISCNK